ANRAIAFQDAQFMLDKIEADLEGVKAMWNWRSRQAAGSHVESDMPGVIDPRSLGQTNFPDNLRPHVQRGCRLLPLCKRKRRPKFVALVTGNLHLLIVHST